MKPKKPQAAKAPPAAKKPRPQPSTEPAMVDKDGKPIIVGSTCIYLANDRDRDRKRYNGKTVRVRMIKPAEASGLAYYRRKVHCRIDDDLTDAPFEKQKWTWSAWATSEQLIVISSEVIKNG